MVPSWARFAILGLCVFGATAAGAPPDETRGLNPLGELLVVDAKPLEVREKDDELLKLLKQRYNAALEDLNARFTLYRTGRMPYEDTCDSIERFAKAASEVAQTPDDRVSKLELAHGAAKHVEQIVRKKLEAEVEGLWTMRRATYTLNDVEIQLYRAREVAGRKK